jgi:uncharacterized protein DUF5677
MALEGLTRDDFQAQKKNNWRLQGKPFYRIFSAVVGGQLYASTYGMMSESIHGSWNESMDYCLRRNDDGTFSTFPFYQPADIRFVTPTIKFCSLPFRLWLTRIEVDEKYLFEVLNWVDRVNATIYRRFDEEYDGR